MADNLSLNPTCANNANDWRGTDGGTAGWTRQTGQTVGDTGRTTCGRRASISGSAWPDIGTAGCITASSGASGGKTYSYVAWVRSSTSRAYRHALMRRNGNGYEGDVFGPTSTSLTANTWTKIRGTGTCPTGGTYDRIGVHNDFTASGSTTNLDVGAVRIVEGNVPDLEFADGDTSGWVWDGTAGNSTSQESPANPPTVDAGADATVTAGQEFTRTASENDGGATITARQWEIVSVN